MMEVLQAMLGGMGGGEDDSFVPMATPAASSSSKPAPKSYASPEEQAAQEKREVSNAAKDRGNALYKSRSFADALTAYDEALLLDAGNVMVLNNKAAVYVEMGECDSAIEVCSSIFDKASAAGVRITYEEKAKVHGRIAAAHLKKGDIPAALKSYGAAQVEAFDKNVERKIKTLELEFKKRERQQYINPQLGLEAKERGNTAFREGKFPEAIPEYEEACKRDPTNAPYHNNLAAAYLKMGVWADAKKEVEKSLELDKTYVKAWAKKGDIEFFMKEYHKSMDSYKAGLQLEPDNSLCRQGLQKTIGKINEGSSAEEDKERAAHAMADPEIQAILSDPSIRQVLTDFQENPKFAQQAMQGDADIRRKIEKLVAAGVLQVK